MTLDLTAYDDAALEALAPKGLVRRARREVEAGAATIAERDDKNAVVETDGQTVRIDTRGPGSARCTCPAGSICRHVLVAVMALNADPIEAPAGSAEGEARSATAELCAMTQSELIAFAGANWQAAVALAAASASSSIEESGPNCTVDLTDAPTGVTFIAGQGLKGAAFKGPKSRARTVVAAAAILVRAKHGHHLDIADAESGIASEEVARDYLDDAAKKLASSTRMVLAGASPIAADTLFDLAISARAEAAPRLTAQLRALAKQAQQAATRAIQFEPEAFLADAARAFALIQALKQSPRDPQLTGSLRRDFAPAPAFDLWMLGARRWTTEAGSRGLTLHGFAPEDRCWRSLTLARGPGMDPAFDPQAAFGLPVWGARAGRALIGQVLHLPRALLADDGAIAPTLPEAAIIQSRIPDTRTLLLRGAAIASWAELRSDFAARVGDGLRRRLAAIPALLAPARFGGLGFDDFAQTYEWEAFDQFGDKVLLTLPADDHLIARRLAEMSRPPLLLVETLGDRPALRPIAVLTDSANGIEVVNLNLDQWTHPPRARGALDAIQSILPRRAPPPASTPSPLVELTQRALDGAATVCAGGKGADLEKLERLSETAGFVALARAVQQMQVRQDDVSALACAYIAQELETTLNWTRSA
jgi:hypothetical protein